MFRPLFYIFISLCFLAACSIEEHPKDQIDEDKVYTSPEELYRHTIASIYSYVGGYSDGQGLQGTCRGVYDLQTFGSDEAVLPTRGVDWYDGGIWQDLYKHSWNSGHEVVKNSWLYLYKVIAICNRALETIDKHKDLLFELQYQRFTAEVRAIRAIFYFYLLDLFGNVPVVISTGVSMNDAGTMNRSYVFEFLIYELQQAYSYLPNRFSQIKGGFYGRVTQAVAAFVLAKLYLNAEVYKDDIWTDNERPNGSDMEFYVYGTKMNAWEAAAFFCDLIGQIGYKLEQNYYENFTVNNENSVENIWTIPLDQFLYTNQQQNMFRSYHSRHAAAYGFSGENGSSATLKVLEVNGYHTPELDFRFENNYWSDNVTDINGYFIQGRNGEPMCYLPEKIELDLSYSPYKEMAGARMKKYEVDIDASEGGKLMDNDIVLFRYADVLLMKAEALVRNGDSGQKEFDQVRERAHMSKKEATLDNIYDERLIELAWEGWRRNDMIRFDRYKSLYQGEDAVDESDNHTIVYPIPSVVVTLNPYIPQNPGY